MKPRNPARGAAILVVDDESIVLDLLSEALTRAGYVPLLAKNPQAALRICKEYPGTLDVLLTDLLMPGMNGLELVTQALALRPQIQVLYMSDSRVVAGAFGDEPGVPFLEKPFSPGVLIRTVETLLASDDQHKCADQRQYPRVQVEWPLSFSAPQMAGAGLMIDLSMGGCSVRTQDHVPQGIELELRITPPDRSAPISVEQARVQWSTGGKFGAQFLSLQTTQQQQLSQFLGTLLSQSHP